MADNPQQPGTRRVVGYAGDFKRHMAEDGQVSIAYITFELHITAKSVLKEIDSLNVNIEVMEANYHTGNEDGAPMVIKDAVIMGLYVTDQENAWSELNVERAA